MMDSSELKVVLKQRDETIIKQADEVAELRAERDATGETLRQEVEEMQEFIDKLWQAVILDHKPDYGDWEYPDQAHRHIVTEVTELRAERADTIELCETIEAWVTKLDDDGEIMPEPPWYQHLVIQIAFMKGEM